MVVMEKGGKVLKRTTRKRVGPEGRAGGGQLSHFEKIVADARERA